MNKIIPAAIALAFIFAILSFINPTVFGGQIQCLEAQPPGDKASYAEGWHQIFNGDLLFGRDDVYTTDYGYLQCFCSPEGNGIQTTWPRSEAGVWGEQWGLGKHFYSPENQEYFCGEVEPTPSPTAEPTPEPTPFEHQACGRGCVVDDDCKRYDENYICYKDNTCRVENNSEDPSCNPRDGVITIEELRQLPAGIK